jgi:hypothetical protein
LKSKRDEGIMLGDGILDDDGGKRKAENEPGEERHGAIDAFPAKLKALEAP